MPILLPPQADLPLEQGDVLGDVRTYVTESDIDQSPTTFVGDVLVVSRPCNALRDKLIIVAPIKKRALSDLREVGGADELASFFKKVRDGDGAPDTFYLGEMQSGSTDRFFAKFDTLQTIELPEDPARRSAYLLKHRRFRLNPEFARDLHVRLFRAFASLGFDDERWWSDGDLALVLGRYEAQRAQMKAKIQQLENDLAIHRTSGGAKKEDKKLVDELEIAKRDLVKAETDFAPLIAEARRRQLPVSP